MPSLQAIIFLVELAVQLINSVGAATINGALWSLYSAIQTSLSKDKAEHQVLKKEYLSCRRELNATSSQDEFAKWAKLRRTHDKLLERLEKKKSTLDASKAKFDTYATTIRWVLTRGVQWFVPFWYAKQPMFWLPYGWFPYYVEWFLSFPRAPIGSVSIVAWQWACTGILVLAAETITAILGLVLGARQKSGVPMAGNTQAAPGEKARTNTAPAGDS